MQKDYDELYKKTKKSILDEFDEDEDNDDIKDILEDLPKKIITKFPEYLSLLRNFVRSSTLVSNSKTLIT